MMAAKNALFAFLYRSGIARFANWSNRGLVRIVCYHGVTGRAARAHDDPAGLQVRRDRFEAHLEYLQRRHHVMALHEYVEARRRGRSLPPYSIVLTFDDGYKNVLTVAAPALRQMAMPATFFLVTEWVDNAGGGAVAPLGWNADHDKSFLSWEEAAVLSASSAFDVGSHTRSHAILPELSREEAEEEMAASLLAVRNRLGADEVFLAYPKGRYADWIVDLAHEVGYGCALTTDGGLNARSTDLFRLRRTLVGDDDDVAAFAVRISGLGSWLSRARSKVSRSRRHA